LEFTQQVHALLKEDGIYMLNLIDLFNSGGFLAGVVNTCRQVFPFVYVFNTGRQTAVRDTFVVLSSKHPLNVQDVVGRIQRKHVEYTGLMLEPAVLDGLVARHHALVLTDDYAPVENLLRPVVKSREIDPGELLYLRAKAFSSQGKLKEAIEQATAGLEYHPRWPEVHAFLADLLTRRGDTEGAIEHWRAAIADTQRPALPRYQLGVLLLNLGRTEEALAEFIEATETEPAYWDAQLQSAKLATALGRMELAVKYWGNVVALAPDDMSSRYNLGLAYAGNRQYEAAVTEWERVLQATPGDPDTLRNLVLTYTGLGKYDEAWKYVHRSRELQLEVDPAVLESLRVKSGRHE
ncbi:MAG: fused MFS/spermidine synthase, partial [Candidatus Hydrogenedentes bacterium]|nr:fused MFS/spermidine synthase [Candidatus Hydrogenedentota bacterium]